MLPLDGICAGTCRAVQVGRCGVVPPGGVLLGPMCPDWPVG